MRDVAHSAASPDQAPYAVAEAVFADAKAYLSSREAQQMSESELERELHRQRTPGEAAGPVEGVDDVERSQRRLQERHPETTFGTVQVARPGGWRSSMAPRRSSTARAPPSTLRCGNRSHLLVATVNFPFVATENRTLCWLAVAGLRSTLLSKPTARRQVADARMGDEDAAEALSGTGRLEGGVGEALRGESPDAPRVDRVEPVGPGPVVRGRTVFAAAARTAQAGPLRRDHRFPSRGVPRAVSEAAVRRGPRGWLRR